MPSPLQSWILQQRAGQTPAQLALAYYGEITSAGRVAICKARRRLHKKGLLALAKNSPRWQLTANEKSRVEQAEALEFFPQLGPASVDLVFGSGPYVDARTYGIGAQRNCREWVEWMLQVTTAAVQVSKGAVIWVAAGVQRKKCYWPACEGLMWEWWQRGNQLWRPCIWWKVDEDEGGSGVPGSGGKQWLRNDWEYAMAFMKEGWLEWADNTAMGHPPVCRVVGGAMSNRTADGVRVGARGKNGRARVKGKRPMPEKANPGNCIIVKARVGGGLIGDKLAHENEAPFPETLAEFFVRSFCPPGGIVCDSFCGSGTTGEVALRWGRRFIGCDVRLNQVELTRQRLAVVAKTSK
jgi:hypothetical protein